MKTVKIYELFNEHEQAYYDVYQAPGIETKTVTIEVPRDVREPRAVRKLLLRGGADLPSFELCEHALVEAIAFDGEVVRRAVRTGWRDDGARFVTHLDVVGDDAGRVLPPPSSILRAAGEIEVRGDLKSWKKLIAVAEYSTAMMVALCAAFAAALLSPLERPSFALVLVGRSRGGKTTAQVVVASVIGWGKEEHLPTLNATPAGLLEAGLVFNDCMLPINEIGTAQGAKSEKHRVVSDTTYALMTGKDVMRHSTWSGGGASSSFKVLPIFSSERSPDEWAALGGEAREAGETVRLITLPAIREGDETVFDRPPSIEEGSVADWADVQFEKLRLGLPEQRGTAWRAFLKTIIADRENVLSRVKEDMRVFQAAFEKSALTPIKRDIVSKFALVYAGGMAAIDAGVLPFDEDTIMGANHRACRRALKCLPDPMADLRADVELLMKKLKSGGVIDKMNAPAKVLKSMLKADGFFEQTRHGRVYSIRATTFMTYFRSQVRANRVLDWLDEQGLLLHQKDRRSASNAWAQKQVTWPDGISRPRSICIVINDGADVLELLG